MIRRISIALLLAHTSISLAMPLYKWIEPDGSITFSPNKPPAGVTYETVSGGSEISSSQTTVGENSALTAQGSSESAPITPSGKLTAAPLPTIKYAPGTPSGNIQQLPEAISRSAAATARTGTPGMQGIETAIAVSNGVSTDAQSDPTAQSEKISAARHKQNRCQDLRKRVVSLERRLKSRLTPEDMDNTVIHMARYQHSFDQYCAQ